MVLSGRLIAIGVVAVGFLLLSVANVVLFNWWQTERDAATQAGEQLAIATRSAQECSAGVESLVTEAKLKAASAAKSIASARKKAENAERRVRDILSSGPSQPGNDCASAQDRVNQWLTERDK